MAGLAVAEDGMRPTCELRQVESDLDSTVGIQQLWVSDDRTYSEWRWLPKIPFTDLIREEQRRSAGLV